MEAVAFTEVVSSKMATSEKMRILVSKLHRSPPNSSAAKSER